MARKFIAFGVATVLYLSLTAAAPPPQAGALCEKGEKIVISCAIRKPAKIVSLCSSPNLSKEQGYVQYRFGLPGKVELEFPKTRSETHGQFRYYHYFRAQVDQTEISFTSEGYQYAIVDDYNGEQKPASHEQGIRVTAPNGKETTLSCSGRAQADYGNLGDVFGSGGL